MTVSPRFVHLHVHSAYSLAEGAIRLPKLAKLCAQDSMPAVAVTDTSNLFGAMEFSYECAKAGIQPIIGCQVLVGEDEAELVLLVQSETGYRNLCHLVSQSFLLSDGTNKPRILWDELEPYASGLICLTGGLRGPLSRALLSRREMDARDFAQKLKSIFSDRIYIELQRHGIPEQDAIEDQLISIAYDLDIPLVATNDCYFPTEDFYDAHDALLCIADGRYVTEADRRRVTHQHYFKSQDEMVTLFSDVPEAIENTVKIAQRCHFFLETVSPMLPPFESESGLKEPEELRRQAEEGLRERLEKFVYPLCADERAREEKTKFYHDRLAFEINTINTMGFAGYFLIVSDFIKWAKGQHIPVGPGRGSGAGSLVAWALQITDLDPIQFNLLFERFLNPERVSMPDFDIDFCQDRRDEVIRYVQSRYGRDRVAQIITFGQLKARAVVRDVGRVLQMPYGQVDKIAKMIPNHPANPMTLEEALEKDPELQAQRADDNINRLLTIALQLEGLYRHASTHAAGVVIGDRPLEQLVPVYRDPSSDMPVTQFNMKYVEQAGLVKFDFLGLKTLTVIQKAAELIAEKHEPIDILKIPLDDKKTYDLISSGQTVGIFQLESSGMRDTLRKMQPNRFEDIIALVALYRPGPMDNIPKYCNVKAGKEAADYLHPKLQTMLEETYGIMVYQEQVMQAAQILAGYTLGGADLLRRAMGKKIKAEMDAQRDSFVKGAVANSNIKPERAEVIFEQIEKFAGYGFNKSHAAAYALIAYQTAWLKANYPVEFMAASMTLDLDNTDKLALFRQAVDKMNIHLLPPDINESHVLFSVDGDSIRYALAAVKGVGAQAMQLIVAEREKNGKFLSLDDFLLRLESRGMNKKQFENLAAAGAFDNLHPNRAQLFENAERLVHYAQARAEERLSNQNSLFGNDIPIQKNAAVQLMTFGPVWSPLDKLSHEFDAIGFYLSAHPLDTKKGQLERLNIISSAGLDQMLADRSIARVQMAGVVIRKSEKISQKTGNKFAFLTLSDASGVYEVMVFTEVLTRSRDFLEEGKSILLTVDAESREEQTRLTVQDIRPLDEALADRIREVVISIKNDQPLAAIKSRLQAEERDGTAHVIISLITAAGEAVKIKLPGVYHFSPETRNELYKTEGVASVSEL
jgi:DNA polymerase III subunit alpha